MKVCYLSRIRHKTEIKLKKYSEKTSIFISVQHAAEANGDHNKQIHKNN